MLVLTRRRNETIRIGDDIRVKMLDIEGGYEGKVLTEVTSPKFAYACKRKEDGVIMIQENPEISVLIVEIRVDKVRYGITCPREIPVHREEVYLAIQRGSTDRKKDA